MNISEFKLFLVQREFIPKEILELLAKDDYHWIRASVAKNSNISKEILEILAKDKDYWIRKAVEKNPNVSKEILSIFI